MNPSSSAAASRIGKASSTWKNPLDPDGDDPKPSSSLPVKPVASAGASSTRSPVKRAPPGLPDDAGPSGGRAHEGTRRRSRSPSGREASRYPPSKRFREDGESSSQRSHSQAYHYDDNSSRYGEYDRYRPGDAAGSGRRSGGYDRDDGSRYEDRPYRSSQRDEDYRYTQSRHRHDRHGYDDYPMTSRDREDGYERGQIRDEASDDRRRGYTPRRHHHDDRRHRSRTRSRSRGRGRKYSRSPERRRSDIEEGEIDPEEGEIAEDEPESSLDMGRTGTTTVVSSQQSETGPTYQPIKIKNRPTKRPSDFGMTVTADLAPANGASSHASAPRAGPMSPTLPPPPPPPPPATSRPDTPPAPPTPPPPVEQPPTPPPPTSPPAETPQAQAQPPAVPHNRALDLTKSQAKYDEHGDRADGKTSVPHAPNRNLLAPTTRPTTPAARGDMPAGYETPVKKFRRPTAEQEMDGLHKSFFGTTTLAAYDLGDKLGEGTFGVVTKGVEIATKKAIALKKLITHNPRDGVSVTTVREIKILKSLNHPSIVEIMDMVVQRKNPSDRTHRGDVFMVFPYMDHDLCGLLSNSDFKLSHSVAKLLMRQILEGMDYIHANNFIHRDIKTANILVDREGGIKIADFGLARTWTFDELMPKHLATEYTNMVVTRWYRAPELLLGDRHYGPAVDMWSLGCVLGEMYHRLPILQGETDRDQLFKIFGRVGRPSEESFPGWNKLPGFPDSLGYPWDKVTEDQPLLQTARKWGMDRGGADLMLQLLRLDPVRRLTANDALDHSWFWCSPKTATRAKNLITVESSHEMTQRIKNEPPHKAIIRPIPQRHMPPQRPPPQQAWNGNGPHRHGPGVGVGGQHANPYAGGPPPNMNNNPYASAQQQQRSRPPFANGPPPMAAYQNGGGGGGYHSGPPPGLGQYPSGFGGGGGGGPFGPGGGGPNGLPSRPHLQQGGSGFNARPPFGGGGGGGSGGPMGTPGSSGGPNRRAPPPPSGFALSGGANLPRRPPPPPAVDAGRRGGGALPYD